MCKGANMGMGDLCSDLGATLEELRKRFDAIGPEAKPGEDDYGVLADRLEHELSEALEYVKTFPGREQKGKLLKLPNAFTRSCEHISAADQLRSLQEGNPAAFEVVFDAGWKAGRAEKKKDSGRRSDRAQDK